MKSKASLLVLAAALAAAPWIMSGVASAASPTATPTPATDLNNVVATGHYDNANEALVPGTLRLVNNSGTAECVNIYWVDPSQEMKECCSCTMSDKSMRIIDINSMGAQSPFNGVAAPDGSISVVTSAQLKGGTCGDPGKAYTTAGGIDGWVTNPDASDMIVGSELQHPPVTKTVLSDLQKECAAGELVGSGTGICQCGTGD